ncbi:MAG: cupin domain-containing protein [Terriglobales bacterium]
MRRVTIALIFLLVVAALAQQPATKSKDAKAASAKTEVRHTYTQQQMQWGPPPPFVPPGAQMTVLEGDPGASTGSFTIRVKTPDGYVVPPHWHPKRENVTVVSGAMRLGMGDKMDESKMTSLPAGSFAYLDPDMHHYVKMKGETVVQIHGPSPLAFNYVNPNDDPSKKK